MRRKIIFTAVLSIAATVLTLTALGWSPQAGTPGQAKLDNARVRVSEIDYSPGEPRPVILAPPTYGRLGSETGANEIRRHKSGDAIWHNKGEDAPVLTNRGDRLYRTLVIEVK